MDRDKALKEAERLLKQGRVDAALRTLEKASGRGKGDVQTLNRIGDLLARQKQASHAIGYYERVAQEFARTGFLPKAIAMYKKVLRLSPNRAESLFELGNLFLKQDLTGEARAHLSRAADQFLKSQDFARARETFGRLVVANPADLSLRSRLAEALAAEGEKVEAAKAFLEVGRRFAAQDAAADAEQAFQRAADLVPEDARPVIGIAKCKAAAGDGEAAFRYLEKQAQQRDNSPEIVGELAILYQEAGKADEAFRAMFGDAAPTVAAETYERFVAACRERGVEERMWERFDTVVERWSQEDADGLASVLDRLAGGRNGVHVPALQRLFNLHKARNDPAAMGDALERLVRAYDAKSMNDEASLMRDQLRELRPESPLLAADAEPASAAPDESAPPPPAPATPSGADAEVEAEAPEKRTRHDAEAPAVPLNRADEEFVSGRMTQAEILEKYGLQRQALDQIQEVTTRFPGDVQAQERRVELLKAKGAIGTLRDALVDLALAQRAAGNLENARATVKRAGEKAPLGLGTRALLQELGLYGRAADAAAGKGKAGLAAAEPGEAKKQPQSQAKAKPKEVVIDFEADSDEVAAAAPEAAAPPPQAARAAGRSPKAPEDTVLSVPAPGEDDDLLAITAALESELFEGDAKTTVSAPESEESLEEVFSAFKRHVEEEVGKDDHRTHYDLGIAYKEMGLIEEAIGEFRIALGSTELRWEASSMLAICHREMGDMQQAAKWYREALGAPGVDAQTGQTLRYDLAEALLQSGDEQGALNLFRDLLQIDPTYRDVQTRITELETRLRS